MRAWYVESEDAQRRPHQPPSPPASRTVDRPVRTHPARPCITLTRVRGPTLGSSVSSPPGATHATVRALCLSHALFVADSLVAPERGVAGQGSAPRAALEARWSPVTPPASLAASLSEPRGRPCDAPQHRRAPALISKATNPQFRGGSVFVRITRSVPVRVRAGGIHANAAVMAAASMPPRWVSLTPTVYPESLNSNRQQISWVG